MMKRRLIQLTAEQEAMLRELAERDGNSIAAHIRTSIDQYLRRGDPAKSDPRRAG
jgi:hypothetical protein